MNENMQKILFHWTSAFIGGGMLLTPVAVIASRNKEFIEPTVPVQLADEKLQKLVDEELEAISKRRWFKFEPKNVSFEVQDDVESSTGGLFFFLNDAIFRFSSRLTLDDDVATVRQRHPNFLGMFKRNFSSQPEQSVRNVWRNFRTALGFRDLAAIFKEKDLYHLSVNSSALPDADIQTVFLSPNAKKFAIARELLSADRFCGSMLFLNSLLAFSFGWVVFIFCKSKMSNERLAVSIAYGLSLLQFFLFDLVEQRREVIRKDAACMALGDAYVSGAKEYLQASITLGKCLRRLTHGQARFDALGDYERHAVPYTLRLREVKKEEGRILESKKQIVRKKD